MSVVLAHCPGHADYSQICAYCQTAEDVTNQSLHPLGLCNRHCKSLDHYATPDRGDQGVMGKGGLVYYADGTTSADRPLAVEDAR